MSTTTAALQTTHPRRKQNRQTDNSPDVQPTTNDGSKPTYMTDDKLHTGLSANTNMAKLTNQFQRTRLITSSPDKHYSLDYEDNFRPGFRNVSHPPTTVLFRTTLTMTITLHELLILLGSNHLQK